MNELIKKEKLRTIKLADGKEYTVSPLNLNVMMAIEEEFDCNFSDFGKLLTGKKTKQVTAVGKLLFILLKENHPDLSLADIGRNVSINNFEEVSDVIGAALFGEGYGEFKQSFAAKQAPKV